DTDRPAELLVLLDTAAQDRPGLAEAPVGQPLGVFEPRRAFAPAGGQGLQLELIVRALGQDDRPALGVEYVDRVVQDGVEEFLLALDADEVVPGAEEGH